MSSQSMEENSTAEAQRLREDSKREKNWKRWGPYLSERQWATVREDYSENGNCWEYFPHDHARSRAYRWGEDGLLGFTDRECRLCFALALWNGKDPILKERLFGLTNAEGNHGEDVKECYFYLDSTPTHSYCKSLYKYPQEEFPYKRLIEENQRRGLNESEFELADTGIFDQNRYFDIFVEYAKNSPNDVLIKITVANRSTDAATLHLLPTLWFRNNWSWGADHEGSSIKPSITLHQAGILETESESLQKFHLAFEEAGQISPPPLVLFTENETNGEKLYGLQGQGNFRKDAFHEYLIHGQKQAVNSTGRGTKASPLYQINLNGNEARMIRLRLYADTEKPQEVFDRTFDEIFDRRKQEANEFYSSIIPKTASAEEINISRQAYAGLLWNKQFYHYIVRDWLKGDSKMPQPPESRLHGRNSDWKHIYSRDVLSMPDNWEYPWFAAWDLAFHMLPFSKIDPTGAKQQLMLLLREWYMHPNGQIPAYEFAFSDVNPPVHAWAAWRVYKITGKKGARDRAFLESVFQKLLFNFTWWTNRKDPEGNNLFAGGFLGLDNIGVFDRSKPLPMGGYLRQADGTAWMAFYCLTMLAISIELAQENHVYEDLASKFFEHFIAISDAINMMGNDGLWNENDGFYYDQLKVEGKVFPMTCRSLVGLIPLLAVEVFDRKKVESLPGFHKRMQWFIENRKDLSQLICHCDETFLLSIPSRERLMRALRYMLDESEFFSSHGVRSVSAIYREHAFSFDFLGENHSVGYVPGEGNSRLFGGNSNWRGPVWFPINYLLIEALERYHHFYQDTLKLECPTGSGNMLNLKEIAQELARRLSGIFMPDPQGFRACHGKQDRFAKDPYWKDLLWFHEYFHGDTGQGLGANHQTGWTSLVTRCFESFRMS